MAQRPTRRAGIPKPRVDDPQVRKSLNAIVERIEVLDGIRGDALDKAITWRDLEQSGFTIKNLGAGGGPRVTNTPGPGDGTPVPTAGPTTAPTALAVTETFLALLLTWNNPPFNLQFVEIWRNTDDNLSTAIRIGTSITPLYVDYVGASASYYYWVRAVATDGSVSAFNSTDGTLGTTGIDPADFEFELNISAENLDAALTARIDLIDNPTTGLVDRVGAAEGDIVALDSRTTSLESTASALITDVDGNSALITANSSALATTQTSVSQLLNDVDVLDGRLDTNTASLAAVASDILNLNATVGALDSEDGQTWDFSNSLDGWTVSGGTLTPAATTVVYNQTGADPKLLSPAFSLTGGIFTQVVARVRQTISGGGWQGQVAYSTGAHAVSSSYTKTIPDPNLPLSEWRTLTWDMSDLTTGGNDWVNSTITGLDIQLGSGTGGRWEIDWIIVAKFSTSAVSDALEALDVRVTTTENSTLSQATRITNLESSVNDSSSGIDANAAAITALTTDVLANSAGVTANSNAITALETTVNDPTNGVAASALAIDSLETDVSTLDGTIVSQATQLTQLSASVTGGFASVTNALTTLNEAAGTSLTDAEVQAYTVGGRSGVAARIETNGNAVRYIRRADNARLYVEPRAVYEVKVRVYHNRPTTAGSFYLGAYAYAGASGTSGASVQAMRRISTADTYSSSTSNPYWFSTQGAVGDNEWLDLTFYLAGDELTPASIPDATINGSTSYTGASTLIKALQTNSGAPYVELRVLNYNTSPTYGDATTTTLYVTDFSVSRVDIASGLTAAIEVESSVRASQIGDLNALYTVKADLSTGGDPYVAGFGLAADIINGAPTSAFGIRADQFYIAAPDFGTAPGAGPGDNENSAYPFSVGLVDGAASVGINGELIVDGSIRASSIVANSITGDQIAAIQLSAISADLGEITTGLLRTAESPAFRVEIQDQAATDYPIWYGSGAKSTGTGLFYVDQVGNVVLKGLLDASVIKQSYFAPADGNNSFRVACDYPANFSGGLYTGKKAHLSPILTEGYQAPLGQVGVGIASVPGADSNYGTAYTTQKLRVFGPTYSGSTEYGRMGTNSEVLNIRYNAGLVNDFSGQNFWALVKYQYNGEAVRHAFVHPVRAPGGARQALITGEEVFITREADWEWLDIWLEFGSSYNDGAIRLFLQQFTYAISTPNFGVSDIETTSTITETTGSTTSSAAIIRDPGIFRRYL